MERYSDRGIEIPEYIKKAIKQLKFKGDYISDSKDKYSSTDVSVLSKETGVEYAKVTIGKKCYIIRGDKNGTTIPESIIARMKRESGKLDFHSHPHDDDCIPSVADRNMIKHLEQTTGQKTSQIITPNGRTTLFNKEGVIQTGTVPNIIDDERKKALLKIFGGK